MSNFIVKKYEYLKPYVPGEQPQDKKYIKLNTNESPFPPSKSVLEAIKNSSRPLNLYSDPDCVELREKLASILGVTKENLIMTNGSDEALNFCFMAYADKDQEIVFPNITYGFYSVFAQINECKYSEIPLNEEFEINPADYMGINKTIVIANPNAPTGIALSCETIKEILKSNPNNIVIVDEAYADFNTESMLPYINEFKNLIVVRTFSKSRSLAGARLGFAVANEFLIEDLNAIRCSTNPYNVNSLTIAAGIACLNDDKYYMDNCKKIIKTRERIKNELTANGFYCLNSKANFLFIKKKKMKGDELYRKLKIKGILVRHFNKKEIKDYIRVTIGSDRDMDIFLQAILSITED